MLLIINCYPQQLNLVTFYNKVNIYYISLGYIVNNINVLFV